MVRPLPLLCVFESVLKSSYHVAFVLQQRKNEALKESSYGNKFKHLCKSLSWGHQLSTLDYNVIDLDNKIDLEIDCLHGIRFVSTCWIIFIHTCFVLINVSGIFGINFVFN